MGPRTGLEGCGKSCPIGIRSPVCAVTDKPDSCEQKLCNPHLLLNTKQQTIENHKTVSGKKKREPKDTVSLLQANSAHFVHTTHTHTHTLLSSKHLHF